MDGLSGTFTAAEESPEPPLEKALRRKGALCSGEMTRQTTVARGKERNVEEALQKAESTSDWMIAIFGNKLKKKKKKHSLVGSRFGSFLVPNICVCVFYFAFEFINFEILLVSVEQITIMHVQMAVCTPKLFFHEFLAVFTFNISRPKA